MVYTGKPSTGCITCRKRRIKCDERKPHCGNCNKSKRECLGYKCPTTLAFKDETSRIEAKATKQSLKSISPEHATDIEESLKPIRDSLNSISPTISRNVEGEALASFFSDFVLIPRHRDASFPGYLNMLLPLYISAPSDSPLFSITMALAFLKFSHKSQYRQFAKPAYQMYEKTIVRMRNVLKDRVAVQQDDILMTTMLLSMWENLTATWESAHAWGRHFEGICAIVRSRGRGMLECPVSRRLLGSALKLIVVYDIVRCKPMASLVDDNIDLAAELLEHHESFAYHLTRISLAIPSLRARAKSLLGQPMTAAVACDLKWLVQDAQSVDRMLIDWQMELPRSWRYEQVREFSCADEELLESHYYPGPVHSYYDMWTASGQNEWRYLRVILNMLVLNCLERLIPSYMHLKSDGMQNIIALLQDLVNNICSSVPFLLGHETPVPGDAQSINPQTRSELSMDMAGRNSPSQLIRPDKKAHSKAVAVLGGPILIFAIYTSFGVPCIPAMQRLWLKRRYTEIGKRDQLSQVDLVGKYGMPEDFDIRRPSHVDFAPPPFEPFSDDFLDDQCFLETDNELIFDSVPVESILRSNY